MKQRPTPLLFLLLLFLLFSVACDRENEDILLGETVETIDPNVTNFTVDHVRFNNNEYVHTTAAHASECDLFDQNSGNYLMSGLLITNLDDLGPQEPTPQEEGDFFLVYSLSANQPHYAHVMVNISDTLFEACPLLNGLEINIIESEPDVLTGTFEGEFFYYNSTSNTLESIGDLSGNFHVPMVPCE